MQSHVLSTPEGTFEYLQAGSGPPLVLVHGIEDAPHSWQRIIPQLASAYTTFTIDLMRSTWRGTGLRGFAPEATVYVIPIGIRVSRKRSHDPVSAGKHPFKVLGKQRRLGARILSCQQRQRRQEYTNPSLCSVHHAHETRLYRNL